MWVRNYEAVKEEEEGRKKTFLHFSKMWKVVFASWETKGTYVTDIEIHITHSVF